jgi:hypothetical protein
MDEFEVEVVSKGVKILHDLFQTRDSQSAVRECISVVVILLGSPAGKVIHHHQY